MLKFLDGYKTKIAAVILTVIGCVAVVNQHYPLPSAVMETLDAVTKIAEALGLYGIRSALLKK